MHVNRPRPVVVEVPVDVFQGEGEVELLHEETHQPPQGDATDLERMASILAAAERPLIWAGGGVMMSGAWDELRIAFGVAGHSRHAHHHQQGRDA